MSSCLRRRIILSGENSENKFIALNYICHWFFFSPYCWLICSELLLKSEAALKIKESNQITNVPYLCNSLYSVSQYFAQKYRDSFDLEKYRTILGQEWIFLLTAAIFIKTFIKSFDSISNLFFIQFYRHVASHIKK